MSMYDKNHYNIVISLQLIKINKKKKQKNKGMSLPNQNSISTPEAINILEYYLIARP